MSSNGGTIGSNSFDANKCLETTQNGKVVALQDNDLKAAIENTFEIKAEDAYVYHATASVTLSQVQQAIDFGGKSRLHAWYLNQDGTQILPPPLSDIEAYTAIFSSTTSTSKALTAFEKNAKKDSLRVKVAAHLISKRVFPDNITVPKLKKAHANPYFDFWTWSCKSLEWTGPDNTTVNVKQSHHVLPVFYHHFGCVCPSYEAIETIRQLGQGKPIYDVGSGNGYWTFLLRRMSMTVHAIDNGESIWRTMWIGDTIKADGARYLTRNQGAKDANLLLVYPQVTTDFTKSVLKAYKGDLICVAGTQNANGFTSFKDMMIDQYLAVERPEFEKIVQTPLPSFAGKDEALFVFKRKQ